MIDEEIMALGTKHQVLPNFGICCRELGWLKVTNFVQACAVSTLSILIECYYDSHGGNFEQFNQLFEALL